MGDRPAASRDRRFALAQMLSDDYQLVGMSGAVWTKSERLQELTANGSAFPAIVLKDATIRRYWQMASGQITPIESPVAPR
ncbi:MAG: nuclear transport factor 2 family protein [Gemmatimonadales bacterium]